MEKGIMFIPVTLGLDNYLRGFLVRIGFLQICYHWVNKERESNKITAIPVLENFGIRMLRIGRILRMF
jgi:hypothetical protein